MDYTIDKTLLHDMIAEEVSRVADAAYAEDGTPLYDNVALTSRDDGQVERAIEDAVSAFAQRTYDICTPTDEGMAFSVPDFDGSFASLAKAEIDRYISLTATAVLLAQRWPQAVEGYSQRGQAAMGKAIALLKSRKPLNV